GLVYVAVASRDEVVCEKYIFRTTREQHQERTANQALFDLYKLLTKDY
ncbi:MAG: CinA family protein, partial [Paludibacteraceae bacterium]|nr:CinA family protein [Paludibacteraceae bacterium]